MDECDRCTWRRSYAAFEKRHVATICLHISRSFSEQLCDRVVGSVIVVGDQLRTIWILLSELHRRVQSVDRCKAAVLNTALCLFRMEIVDD